MSATNPELRESLEEELNEWCEKLATSTNESELKDKGYLDDDETAKWDKWEGIDTGVVVRIETSGWIATAILRTEKSDIPDGSTRQLIDLVKTMYETIETTKNFRRTWRSDETMTVVDKQVRDAYQALAREARIWVKSELIDECEFESERIRRTNVRTKIRHIQNELSRITGEAQLSSQEAIWEMEATMKERIRQALPSQFSIEAKAARKRGYVWCGVSLFLLVGTASVLWELISNIDLKEEYLFQNIVAMVIAKLALVGVLGYGIVWTARIGHASMHEAAVNLHRALSFATLEHGLQGDRESQLSQHLAREAAKAIYEPHDTGYVKGKGSGSRAESSVLQGLKGMMEEVKRKAD